MTSFRKIWVITNLWTFCFIIISFNSYIIIRQLIDPRNDLVLPVIIIQFFSLILLTIFLGIIHGLTSDIRFKGVLE